MDTEKRTRADVARIKLAKARADYAQVVSFFRNMTSGFELAVVREQKLLFGRPQPVLTECIDYFCNAADRILSKDDAIYARNYTQFVEQVLWIRERIDRNFRGGLDAIKLFTFGDVVFALDIWLKESYEHISDQVWNRSSSNRELASNLPQELAALNEETFQNQIGNTSDIAFAGARLLNGIAATIGRAIRSSIGAKRRQRLTDALPVGIEIYMG